MKIKCVCEDCGLELECTSEDEIKARRWIIIDREADIYCCPNCELIIVETK